MEKWKREEKQNGSCGVERTRTEEMKMARHMLMLETLLVTWNYGNACVGLLPRAVSGFLVLQPGSVTMAPVAIEGHADSSDLGHHLVPW